MSFGAARLVRGLLARNSRSYALAAISTLCLAVAASGIVAQIAWSLLYAPLPFAQAERVVRLFERNDARGVTDYAVSTPNFRSWQEQTRSFSELAAIREGSANLGTTADAVAQRVVAYRASANLWSALGQPLIAGRGFSADEVRDGSAVVISEGLWKSRFDADPGTLGARLQIDGQPHTVVGIAAQDFGFSSVVEAWLPMIDDDTTQRRGDRRLQVIGRLAPEATLESARAELATVAMRLAGQFPNDNAGWSAGVTGAREWMVGGELRQRVAMLLAAVILMLLVACSNVAGLQVARAAGRVQEFGVRHALGASVLRLAGLALGESLVVAAAGALAGGLLAALVLQHAARWMPASIPRMESIGFGLPVAVATALIVTAVALVFALWPALRASRQGVASLTARGARGVGNVHGYRRVLVAAQFALATGLVIAAINLAQQFAALTSNPLGFDPEGVVMARITLPQPTNEEQHRSSMAVYDELLLQSRALPGVTAAGITSEVPMGELNTGMEVATDWATLADPGKTVQASWRIVSAHYFSAMGIPLMRGRTFVENDEPDGSVLLSAGLASRLWPDIDPIGKRFVLGNGKPVTVVGVVGDVRQLGHAQPPTPTFYLPTSWALWPTMTLALRTSTDPQLLTAPLRELARRVAPDYPLFNIVPLKQLIAADVATPRIQSGVFALFALASLLLAAVGVAGVMSQTVVQGAREMAVRVALGASPERLARGVLGQGLGLCLAGVLAGVLLALLLARILAANFGLAPDGFVWSMTLAGVLLLTAGATACWLPARRVLSVSPAAVLRNE